jgi:DNA-binding beta-propeller fold protein YncE/mono/diheme cytochrome c family protein
MIRGLRPVYRSSSARNAFLVAVGLAVVLGGVSVSRPVGSLGFTLAGPSRSTTIALTSDEERLVVANRETSSVTLLRVRDRPLAKFFPLVPPENFPLQDIDPPLKLGEVAVGAEPRCVAVNPNGREAYVTSSGTGTLSVINVEGAPFVEAEIPVGTELRGCAVTPNGTRLYVADFNGKVFEIDPAARAIMRVLEVGGNPEAIAITNNGDGVDTDETVFVSLFFAELIVGGPGEGFDNGKQGVVLAFGVATAPSPIPRINLQPLADSGFTANRAALCTQTNSAAVNNTFCPDTRALANSAVITADPQGVFPNQLGALLVRGNQLFVLSIGAQPEPPVQFTVNVQPLLHVVNIPTKTQSAALNVNTFVRLEAAPVDPTKSLLGTFLNDVVALDANADGTRICGISRGGNQLVCGSPGSTALQRFQVGNIPNGLVISQDGQRAYVNNEVNVSFSIIDLTANTVLKRDVASGTPPAPGTIEHAVLVGKLAFFTALGIPNNGIFDMPIRAFDPLLFRGKMSANAWSSCASCHPDGLSDNVTWIFPAGPRSTTPLDGTYSKHNQLDQRCILWSCLRGSNTDFNNNSRAVQGGIGFADNPASVYDHGPVFGVSDALDAQTFWIALAVRSTRAPAPVDTAAFGRGRALFQANCASCHGGPKWTKSTILHRDNPAFDKDPALGGVPLDPGVTNIAAQITQLTIKGQIFKYLENVGTFNPANAIEIRQNGVLPFGAAGFNVPSLLSLRNTAPYLHNGAAQTVPAVFPLHALGTGTIQTALNATERSDLLIFLLGIDQGTDTFRSAADEFIDTLAQ